MIDNDDNDDDQYNDDNDDDQYNDDNDDDQYREPMNNREAVKLGDKLLPWIMDIQVIKSFAKVVLK